MALEIKAPQDVVKRLTGILWGPPKSGKTTFLMTLPGKKLIVNIDPDGWTAVAGRDDFSVLDLAEYTPDEIVRICIDKLPTMIEQNEDFSSGDSLIFDSASSFGQASLQAAVNKGIGASAKWKPTIEEPGLSAYGARTQYILSTIRNVLRATRKKEMHCWFTSHEDTPTTNKQGDFLYQTMLMSDNAINQAGLSISEIWYLSKMDKLRKVAIAPCRGKQPMGSRIFTMEKSPEFVLKYNADQPEPQPHMINNWWEKWLETGKKLELPL